MTTNFKDGDDVLAWDSDNGFVMAGTLSDVNIKEGEADIDFYNGGSCSSVGLVDCVIVPKWVGKFIEEAMTNLPLNTEE